MDRLGFTSLIALGALAGCAGAPPPILAPDWEVMVSHAPGSAVVRRDVVEPDADAASAWHVETAVYLVREMPERTQSLQSSADLFLLAQDERPLRAHPTQLGGARIATQADGSKVAAALESTARTDDGAELAIGSGALRDGTVITVECDTPDGLVELAVERRAEAARASVLTHQGGLDELVVIERDLDHQPIIACMPMADGSVLALTITTFVEIENMDQHREALARADQEIANSGVPVRRIDPRAVRRELALEGLKTKRRRRNALIVLTSEVDSMATDLALSASDRCLDGWAEALLENPPDPHGEHFAWSVEQTAWNLLAGYTDQGTATDSQVGMLTRHAGEFGRMPMDLRRSALGSSTKEAFETLLMTENRRLLASADPAARVRAYDWLAIREAAPEGFDPLGSRDERRAVLRKMVREQQARQQQENQEGGSDDDQ